MANLFSPRGLPVLSSVLCWMLLPQLSTLGISRLTALPNIRIFSTGIASGNCLMQRICALC